MVAMVEGTGHRSNTPTWQKYFVLAPYDALCAVHKFMIEIYFDQFIKMSQKMNRFDKALIVFL